MKKQKILAIFYLSAIIGGASITLNALIISPQSPAVVIGASMALASLILIEELADKMMVSPVL